MAYYKQWNMRQLRFLDVCNFTPMSSNDFPVPCFSPLAWGAKRASLG